MVTSPSLVDSYDIKDVDYRWKPKEDVLILDAEMSEFELKEATTHRKMVKYVIGEYYKSKSSSKHSYWFGNCLKAKLT